MIVTALVHFGLLVDPGIDEGCFLDVGEGVLTPKFYAFRKQAEQSRQVQLKRLALEGRKAKEEEKEVKTETAFD
jgi:hypothetical protein